MKRLIASFALAALLLTTAAGCQPKSRTITVGASAVPHAQILAVAAELLKKDGITLKVVEFNDYVQPNLQLADKQLDANFFQHIPYLEDFSSEHKLDLTYIAKVHVEPFGVYSQKHAKGAEFVTAAVVAIPNDATNAGRALLLLQASGLLTLRDGAGTTATVADIIANPRQIKFVELEAAQLPRSLPDVDYAIINGNYALQANFNPLSDSLYIEGGESPYVNVLAVRKESATDPTLQKLAAALNSPEVKDFILKTYKGSVVPAFK